MMQIYDEFLTHSFRVILNKNKNQSMFYRKIPVLMKFCNNSSRKTKTRSLFASVITATYKLAPIIPL